MIIHDGIERIVRRLGTRASLDEADRSAIRALPFSYRTIDINGYLLREGEVPDHCMVLLAGFAYRHKSTGDGARQILAVHMPGEFLDLQNSMLRIADHNVQALTRAEIATVPVAAMRKLVTDHPVVGQAMWIDTLVDASVFREWILNVGRRDSLTRLAHLLCEFALRLEAAGLASDYRYELPMTQEQLADTTGLTPVHINRVLKEMGRLGLIDRDKRYFRIVDWDRMREVGDFNSRYLHLEENGSTNLDSARPTGTGR